MSKEKLLVNGLECVHTKVDATIQGSALSYRNYYYSSAKIGTIQIMTWASQDDIAGYEKELAEFVNGFHLAQ